MIGYIRGEILEHSDGKMLVGVTAGGSAASVLGYSVTVPQSPAYLGFLPQKSVELFIHTHVREDALELFGFSSRLEKEVFLTLLTVNGIGPKGAMGILSRVEPDHLIQAILSGDRDALTQIPGIGKKTAERVVLELADNVRKKMESGQWSSRAPVQPRSAHGSVPAARPSTVLNDAKAALIGLGYRENEISTLLNRVMVEADETPTRAEDLVRTALRQLV